MNIEDLISQYVDAELTSEQEAELHHRLSVSPDDRRRFRQHVALHGLAQDRRVLQQPGAALRAALFERLRREEGKNSVVPANGTAAKAAPLPFAADAGPHAAAGLRAPLPSRTAPAARRRRRLSAIVVPFVLGLLSMAAVWRITDGTNVDSPVGTIASNTGRSAAAPAPESEAPMLADAATPRTARVARPEPHRSFAAESPTEHGLAPSAAGARSSDASERAPRASERGRMAVGPDMKSVAPSEMFAHRMQATSIAPMTSARAQPEAPMSRPDDRPVSPQSSADGSGAAAPEVRTTAAERSSSSVRAEAAPSNGIAMTMAPSSTSSNDTVSSHAGGSTTVNPLQIFTGRPPALFAQVRQSFTLGLSTARVLPEVDLRLGGVLGNDHQIYAIVGRSGYRAMASSTVTDNHVAREVADIITTTNSFGQTKLDTVYADHTITTTTTDNTAEDRYEFWAGAGYRYSRPVMNHLRAGGGIWAGVGAANLHFGVELPIDVAMTDRIRFEAVPVVEYRRALHAATSNEHASSDVASRSSRIERVTSGSAASSEVTVGLGLGVTVLMR